jgi:uncharacterized protein DUF6931
MSRVRFTTARSVFETFPELASKSATAPTDDPPVIFLQSLSVQEKFEDAVAFCAHLLPRREAVWWGCGTVRSFLSDAVQSQVAGLVAAETWVHEPNDKNRLLALQIGTRSDHSDPLGWLARAAGWSGGMLTSVPNPPVPVPQYLTARAVRVAILLSAQHIGSPERPGRMRACIADGVKLAEPGDDSRRGPAEPAWNDHSRRFDIA